MAFLRLSRWIPIRSTRSCHHDHHNTKRPSKYISPKRDTTSLRKEPEPHINDLTIPIHRRIRFICQIHKQRKPAQWITINSLISLNQRSPVPTISQIQPLINRVIVLVLIIQQKIMLNTSNRISTPITTITSHFTRTLGFKLNPSITNRTPKFNLQLISIISNQVRRINIQVKPHPKRSTIRRTTTTYVQQSRREILTLLIRISPKTNTRSMIMSRLSGIRTRVPMIDRQTPIIMRALRKIIRYQRLPCLSIRNQRIIPTSNTENRRHDQNQKQHRQQTQHRNLQRITLRRSLSIPTWLTSTATGPPFPVPSSSPSPTHSFHIPQRLC